MRIIHFLDEYGDTRIRHDYRNGEAILLEGKIFKSLQNTGDHLQPCCRSRIVKGPKWKTS